MFRNQRLGESREDVLEYLSSRQADLRIFHSDLLVDRAHLLMLKGQNLISGEICAQILGAIDELMDEGPEALGPGEDVHEAIEAYIRDKVGPEGGRIHTGRSRNDEVAACIRLSLREEMLSLMEGQTGLIQTILRLAAEHTQTLVPGFTHTQHAQPTTLAHHLLSHADAAARDLARLEECYARVNQSPLGAAAFASTGFKIDRSLTARLLGFQGLVENSMDAVSTRDFILEVLSDLAIEMVNLSRLAEELVLWSSSEFAYLELDNLYASTSSIMPQKKNPDTAELARARAGSVMGSLVAALAICKALPMSYNRDLQEVTAHLWRAVDWTASTVRILSGCLASLKFNRDRLEKSAGEGFSTATEIADSLVRITGMPFRTAHSIVGRIAAGGERPQLDDVDRIALEIAGFKASERGFSQQDLDIALNPRSNVAVRANTGGPAPQETERMIKEREKGIAGAEERLRQRREHSRRALAELKSQSQC